MAHIHMAKKGKGRQQFLKWSRLIHRHLSYFFTGMIIIYALSGILMNHRDQINPHFTLKRMELEGILANTPRTKESITKEEVREMLVELDEKKNYTKHYFPKEGEMKVFLKGGSSLEVDIITGDAVYERVRRRPLLSDFVKLHYNPGKWWTWFSDLFAVSLILIALTGLFLAPKKKGLRGMGGVELVLGLIVPLLFLFL